MEAELEAEEWVFFEGVEVEEEDDVAPEGWVEAEE